MRSISAVCLRAPSFAASLKSGLKGVLQGLEELDHDPVLFIDELHLIVGAGATTGSTMDASNLLKPARLSQRIFALPGRDNAFGV